MGCAGRAAGPVARIDEHPVDTRSERLFLGSGVSGESNVRNTL
jgi:hypothetical protein